MSRNGAGGGTRTHTTFYGPRILSPVRLPFRHTGIKWLALGDLNSRPSDYESLALTN